MPERPDDIKYTKTHEWIRIEGDTATVGITDFAVEHLGDLVFVDLPDAGQEVEAGTAVAEVESVKAVSEVYSAVGGEIVAVNEDLSDDQSSLANDPFGAGWLFKVKVAEAAADDALLDLAAYEKQLEEEGEPA